MTGRPRSTIDRAARLLALGLLVAVVVPSVEAEGGSFPVALSAAAAADYPIDFVAEGLPYGANWTLTIGASSWTTSGTTLVVLEPNGTYSYNATSAGPYVASGQVTVVGAATSATVSFSAPGGAPSAGGSSSAPTSPASPLVDGVVAIAALAVVGALVALGLARRAARAAPPAPPTPDPVVPDGSSESNVDEADPLEHML